MCVVRFGKQIFKSTVEYIYVEEVRNTKIITNIVICYIFEETSNIYNDAKIREFNTIQLF